MNFGICVSQGDRSTLSLAASETSCPATRSRLAICCWLAMPSLVLLPALLAGCDSENGAAADGRFHINSDLMVVPVVGTTASTETVTYVPDAADAESAALSISGLPSGVHATFAPASVDASSPSSTLHLGADAGVADGAYPVVIVATSRTQNASVPVTVWVVRNPGMTLGFGAELQTPTAGSYLAPFYVGVVDGAGNPPPAGTSVTLAVRPQAYQKGRMTFNGSQWAPTYAISSSDADFDSFGCMNEDTNSNGNLDPGEDYNNNMQLDPVSSVSLPTSTVIADTSGYAESGMTYSRQEARWLSASLTATLSGTTLSLVETLVLPALGDDETGSDPPPDAISPFGTASNCGTPN
ncbi:hypothetical protein [Solimonas terrae]|uniref:Uncharacterized protein n=1 Tax=Solimonas terrae TaxID=1396819 RepID=A0A6M2BM10_9GAMM|nr:hypothetical protein [Solimonas terrae]NGY03167.1 hypothetical protein [Solimonas terrae]